MITLIKNKNLTWIDIESPTPEDISKIVAEFEILPGWAEELSQPTARAKTETNELGFYAALHYPDHPSMRHETRDIEIDYIVTKDLLITAHYEPIDAIMEVAKKFEIGMAAAISTPGLFLEINNELYRGLREELESFRKEIKGVEGGIFGGHEFRMVEEISHLTRRLLDFKQAIRSHHIILKSFELNAEKLWKKSVDRDSVYKDFSRVEGALENCREVLSELRETNDSLLTAKNNEVTKKLTLMAFVTFPLTLVATVLVAHNAPRLFQGEHGFWITVVVLVVLLVIMQIYFAYKKWI
ncbi:MAG: Mg2 transporter protein CorA family protein magnesium transporter [Patescibacteria group bacterium]|nr:Mg2 transporter protein CorA family protein magnesium transporter [Patescibacteria group bacterium]